MKTPLFFRFLGYTKNKIDNYAYSKKIFEKFSQKKIFFIQIGANDGISQDPIYQYNEKWNGILVEPIPECFTKLKENYKERAEGKYFENIAIGKQDGELELIIPIENQQNKEYRHKLASFKENSLLSDHPYEKKQISSLSLTSLIHKYHLTHIDLLVMDIEGYEIDVLSTYDFAVKPEVIYLETRFYSYNDLVYFNEKMIQLGYAIFPEKDNCLFLLQ